MGMDFSIELFLHAIEKNRENDLWETWSLQYPRMDAENFISFEDYKKKSITQTVTKISFEDIEKEMEQVVKAFEERR